MNKTFLGLKNKYYSHRILYSAEMYSRNEGDINISAVYLERMTKGRRSLKRKEMFFLKDTLECENGRKNMVRKTIVK